jgi:6-phosphogluconolactonase
VSDASRVPIRFGVVLPINVQPVITKGEPEVAAANYEALIRQKLANGDPPVFDLILLGMGTDGHTASLFPGTAAIHERRRLVVAYRVEQVNAVRLTFTPPLINAARSVIFLVSGESKAERLREVLTGPYDPDRLPAQVVRPTTGTLQWLVDEAAASRLPG